MPSLAPHLVVPSPTVSSCVLAISTSTLAAGLSTGTLFKIVAPSLVMVMRMLLGSDTCQEERDGKKRGDGKKGGGGENERGEDERGIGGYSGNRKRRG